MIKIYLHDHRDHIELNASGGFTEVRATLNSVICPTRALLERFSTDQICETLH